MPIHDTYARVTPFELAFPDGAPPFRGLERIRREALERGQEEALADPGHFLSLVPVAEVLHELRAADSGGEEVQKHGLLLFHAFHFLKAGRPVYLLETGAARLLIETDALASGPSSGATGTRPPEPAGYLQLPRQLFWIEPVDDEPPEPVDGVFWALVDRDRISFLVVSGMRDDRPGFSVVPLPAVPLDDADSWLDTVAREKGPDFESRLPGGQLDRLYSVETAGEVLKLMARAFQYVARFPDAVVREAGRGEEGGGTGGLARPRGEGAGQRPGPRPTRSPYRRIRLEDQGGGSA